jgi:hypothetical protein
MFRRGPLALLFANGRRRNVCAKRRKPGRGDRRLVASHATCRANSPRIFGRGGESFRSGSHGVDKRVHNPWATAAALIALLAYAAAPRAVADAMFVNTRRRYWAAASSASTRPRSLRSAASASCRGASACSVLDSGPRGGICPADA